MTIKHRSLGQILSGLRSIQLYFKTKYGVDDVLSNSKFYEVLMADTLGHDLIPGHSGSRDARDKSGEYEYKHFKETSSNHSWTFNDYSQTTIDHLNSLQAVIFAHINDTKPIPHFDWYYEVPGNVISKYLIKHTAPIKNARRMINVSSNQIEKRIGFKKTKLKLNRNLSGQFSPQLKNILDLAKELENLTGVHQILTSNKLWELLVAEQLGHRVSSEQSQSDAVSKTGRRYEYKVPKTPSWSFEDISPAVLRRLSHNKIVLATVNKQDLVVTSLYIATGPKTVKRLKEKLNAKRISYKARGKQLRRIQVSLSNGDLKKIDAQLIKIKPPTE